MSQVNLVKGYLKNAEEIVSLAEKEIEKILENPQRPTTPELTPQFPAFDRQEQHQQ